MYSETVFIFETRENESDSEKLLYHGTKMSKEGQAFLCPHTWLHPLPPPPTPLLTNILTMAAPAAQRVEK
jgi:hypothetical protein